MKRSITLLASFLLAFGIVLCAIFGGNTFAPAKADDATVWTPFNFVLKDGNSKVDTRTKLTYADGKITASGKDANGMGVFYHPEITLDGFNANMSLNSWNDDSSDRWFGISFTDVGQFTDSVNEVPYYAKHSESFANAYGAGVIFQLVPATAMDAAQGIINVRFVNLGIQGSVNETTGAPISNAGEYLDSQFNFARSWVTKIQLCNSDWTNKTDYSNIKISLKKVGNAYGFDLNDGYWKRIDEGINWNVSEQAEEVLTALGIDSNRGGTLTADEKAKLLIGPAANTDSDASTNSIIPYLNYGDPFTSLVNFEQTIANANKRLYARFIYQDQFEKLDDVNSFTVNSVMGNAASNGQDFPVISNKAITGKLSATLTEDSLHAGVYPTMVNELVVADSTATVKPAVQTAIDSAASGKTYKVINFKGKLANGNLVELVSRVDISFNMSDYENAKLYQIKGSELVAVDGTGTVSISTNSNTNFVIVYEGGSSSSGGGCGGSISTACAVVVPVLLALAGVIVAKKKLFNK